MLFLKEHPVPIGGKSRIKHWEGSQKPPSRQGLGRVWLCSASSICEPRLNDVREVMSVLRHCCTTGQMTDIQVHHGVHTDRVRSCPAMMRTRSVSLALLPCLCLMVPCPPMFLDSGHALFISLFLVFCTVHDVK